MSLSKLQLTVIMSLLDRLHVKSTFLDTAAGSGLLLIVNVETNLDLRINVESFLDHLSYPDDGVCLGGISQPDCKLVSFAPHIDYSSVHLQMKL